MAIGSIWYNHLMPRNRSALNDRIRLESAISISSSKKEVLLNLGLRAAGGNYKALETAAAKMGLELPKWDYSGQGSSASAFANETVFVENSTYNNGTNLKKRLYEMGWKKECSECGIGAEWNDKPLTLQLEHINGVHNDNRLENLRLLCPNCHSQTTTFAGRSSRGTFSRVRKTCECGMIIHSKTGMSCHSCSSGIRYGSVDRYPSYNVLKAMVEDMGYSAVGRKLGVSDNAVRKRLRKLAAETDGAD